MRPSVIVFDVNETLSDMSPLAARFEEIGAPGHLAKTWFASLLRDGFALAAAGENPAFAEVGVACLRQILHGQQLTATVEDAIGHIMKGMTQLGVHPDVVEGIRALSSAGFALTTLSNGAPSTAKTLLSEAGIMDDFTAILSVENATAWKPARSAYLFAAEQLSTTPESMMLVASHPWDIHGASLAGLRTAWVNRRGVPYPSTFRAPDHTVNGIIELEQVLRNDSATA